MHSCQAFSLNTETILARVQCRPFTPFVVRVSSRETHEVRHPECIAITQTRLVITEPQADRIVVGSVMHVAAVDSLQPT